MVDENVLALVLTHLNSDEAIAEPICKPLCLTCPDADLGLVVDLVNNRNGWNFGCIV